MNVSPSQNNESLATNLLQLDGGQMDNYRKSISTMMRQRRKHNQPYAYFNSKTSIQDESSILQSNARKRQNETSQFQTLKYREYINNDLQNNFLNPCANLQKIMDGEGKSKASKIQQHILRLTW